MNFETEFGDNIELTDYEDGVRIELSDMDDNTLQSTARLTLSELEYFIETLKEIYDRNVEQAFPMSPKEAKYVVYYQKSIFDPKRYVTDDNYFNFSENKEDAYKFSSGGASYMYESVLNEFGKASVEYVGEEF